MGTSTNRRTPNTPVWKPMRAVVGDERVPTARQSAEIWRSATAEQEGALLSELGSAIIARAASLADSVGDPLVALATLRREIVTTQSVGVVTDLATRALGRACYLGGGRERFSAELFAETASYFASRELPSVVGAIGKIATTSGAIALKDELRTLAREAVNRAGRAPDDPAAWKKYVAEIARDLESGGKK